MPVIDSIVPQDLFGQEVNPDNLIKIFESEARRILIAMVEKIEKIGEIEETEEIEGTERIEREILPGIRDAINAFIAKQLIANVFSKGVYGYDPGKSPGEAYREHLRDVLHSIENLAMIIVLMDQSGGFDTDAGMEYIVNALSVAEFPSESVDLNIPNPLTES